MAGYFGEPFPIDPHGPIPDGTPIDRLIEARETERIATEQIRIDCEQWTQLGSNLTAFVRGEQDDPDQWLRDAENLEDWS